MDTFEVDAVVVGAGVVGLACARALARSGCETLLLEAEPWIGSGASSRNSEVIHAGIYYPTGSRKARLCVAGRRMLLEFCASHGVAHRLCGKLIVATDASQLAELEALAARAEANGVPLQFVSRRALAEREPEVHGEAALYSPGTGIVDSHGLLLGLRADLEAAGGLVALNAPVERIEPVAQGFDVCVGGQEPCRVVARTLINAAGLRADRLAAAIPGLPPHACPRHHYARGRYYAYSGVVPFRHLVYPLPEPGGLGVHVTLDLAGRARFGPDVAWVDSEDYGFDDSARQAFIDAIVRYFPKVEPARLHPDQCGIRARLGGPEVAFADFRIDGCETHGIPGLVNLLGIESPGLTACLAIAGEVLARLQATG